MKVQQLVLFCLSLGALLPFNAVSAEAELKAALLYRFVQFSQWSQQAPAAQLYCVAGDQQVFGALQALLQQNGGQNNDKTRLLANVKDGSACTVLYMSDNMAKQSQWHTLLRQKGLLTVVEGAELFRKGAHLGLIAEPNRISFRVNLTQAREQGFHFSAQMLKLAKEIH